jgi:hypothetical protein
VRIDLNLSHPKIIEGGYDRTTRVASLEVDVDDAMAWEVYQYVVGRVTAPTATVVLERTS